MKRLTPYLSMLSAFAFIVLWYVIVTSPQVFVGMDSYAHSLALPFQTPYWSRIFLCVTDFGSTTGIIIGLMLVTFFFRHRPDVLARLYFAIVGSTVVSEYVKNLAHRMRPPTLAWLPPINSYSFPSGHSQSSMVFYGFLALLLYVHARHRITKFLACIVPILMILAVGASRILLNYHFASDVLGGYLLGAFWLTFSLVIPLWYGFYHETVIHSEPLEKPLL